MFKFQNTLTTLWRHMTCASSEGNTQNELQTAPLVIKRSPPVILFGRSSFAISVETLDTRTKCCKTQMAGLYRGCFTTVSLKNFNNSPFITNLHNRPPHTHTHSVTQSHRQRDTHTHTQFPHSTNSLDWLTERTQPIQLLKSLIHISTSPQFTHSHHPIHLSNSPNSLIDITQLSKSPNSLIHIT
jgi:hypothetical protein